eukprot:TRINITY_DN8758_c0_g2_i2.p3 TRINITY_DN8758_c0_g2~~TRINITY_DN8758_c0_g2_i2.p3  ORF type:complete len:150 (-),score=4.73 TRINITY_DN8758_c0_g2_i2:50-499(-)
MRFQKNHRNQQHHFLPSQKKQKNKKIEKSQSELLQYQYCKICEKSTIYKYTMLQQTVQRLETNYYKPFPLFKFLEIGTVLPISRFFSGHLKKNSVQTQRIHELHSLWKLLYGKPQFSESKFIGYDCFMFRDKNICWFRDKNICWRKSQS